MLELDEHVELGKSAAERWEERRKEATDDKTGKILKGFPGRKPGTRNKNPSKVSANQKLREVEESVGHSIDPLEGMAKIANDESLDIALRLTAYKELARYVYPQRKAVDMSIDDGTSEVSSMSDADLESIALGGVL
jgi:hypothetical protein